MTPSKTKTDTLAAATQGCDFASPKVREHTGGKIFNIVAN